MIKVCLSLFIFAAIFKNKSIKYFLITPIQIYLSKKLFYFLEFKICISQNHIFRKILMLISLFSLIFLIFYEFSKLQLVLIIFMVM